MAFNVLIGVGSHSWSLDSVADEDGVVTVTDGVHVLDGLDFGWSMPSGTWPRQPDLMRASFALNLPRFDDAPDVAEGTPVYIEVKPDGTGDVLCRFYGEVTDSKATSRKDRTGVFLSIVAVDPVARLAELAAIPGPAAFGYGTGVTEVNMAYHLWYWSGLAGDPVTNWTSDTRTMGDTPDTLIVPAPSITALLDQAVHYGSSSDLTRMIVAPVIDPTTRLLKVGSDKPTYTLDTVSVPMLLGSGITPAEIESAIVRGEISWSSAKGSAPSWVDVTSNGGESGYNGLTRRPTGLGGNAAEAMTVNCSTIEEAQDVAGFYTIHGLPSWQLDPITIPLTRTGSDLPAHLFPDWTLDEGDPDRAACYGQLIELSDFPDDKHPAGSTFAAGWIAGATCRFSGGHLELDLVIRRDQFSN